MKNKKGQFYIVAAILIALTISGMASVTTYAVIKSEPRTLESLGNDLNEESYRIVDYGIYNQKNISSLINNFTDFDFAPYFLQKTDNANVIFVYGNKTELYSAQYKTESTGEIFGSIGGATTDWNIERAIVSRTLITNNAGNEVKVNILDRDFFFKLRDNEMFYFVMIQEKDGEVYVETN